MQHFPILQGSAHLQVARAPLVPPPLTAPPSRRGDPAIASLQNLRWCAQKLHLPQGHAALPDLARQRTSAGSTCAPGAAAPHRPALSPRRRKAWGTCGSRSPHGFVGVGERIAPCAHLDSACSECDSEYAVRMEGGGVPHPPFATLAGGGVLRLPQPPPRPGALVSPPVSPPVSLTASSTPMKRP